MVDADDEVDGRWLNAVCEYASTCDWCGELTHHDHIAIFGYFDEATQLGYCPLCCQELGLTPHDQPEVKKP